MSGILAIPYRMTYISKSYRTGLTNVTAVIIRPDNVIVGPFLMTELTSVFTGTYYYDYNSTINDPEGEYIITVISPSETYIDQNGNTQVHRDTNRMSLYLAAADLRTILNQLIALLTSLLAVVVPKAIKAVILNNSPIKASVLNGRVVATIYESEIEGQIKEQKVRGKIKNRSVKGKIQ